MSDNDIVKKCLSTIDAYVVWCPTWSKNLGRTLFLGSINFEESIARYFRAFSSYHHPKSSQDESVRQSSMTASSIMSHHEIFEEPPTSSFLASIIDFLVQIIVMDTVSILLIILGRCPLRGHFLDAGACFASKTHLRITGEVCV